MNSEFREGEVYFRVTYPDRNMHYPQIESFVFVGKNMSDDDKEDTWYFQFLESYARAQTRKLKANERLFMLATKEKLPGVLDNDQLYAELKEVASRRQLKATGA